MAIGDTSNTPAVVVVVAVTDGATEESTAEEEAELLAVDDVDLRSVAGSPTMTGSGV